VSESQEGQPNTPDPDQVERLLDELRGLDSEAIEGRLTKIEDVTADEIRARLLSEAGTIAEQTEATVKDPSKADTVAPDSEGDPPPSPGRARAPELLPSTHRQLVGRKLGPYSIRRLIGSGGMGQVWEAIQKNPQRSVALKILRAAIISPSARERFQFEVEILGRLRHPNIAQIYNAGELDLDGDKIPYFAMEFIANAEPLDEYCRKKKLDFIARLNLFIKVCEAVSHGHQRGIIHRDLKPANILVDSEGRPKVIDYGVARASDADTRATVARTNFGQLIGTLQYMSPEQCSADPNEIDIRADVYSLGVILYELMSDNLPYDLRRVAIAEAVQVIQNAMPPRLSTFGKTIAHDVEVIAGKALEKEPDRRYRSAGDLADDVKRFLSDEPIMARAPSMSEILKRYARKNRAMATAIIGITAAILIGMTGTVIFAVQAERAREVATETNLALESSLERESRSRELAETRFTQIKDLANEMLGPIAKELKNLRGATKARTMVTEAGRDYLEELKSSLGDDDSMDGDIAMAHENIGDLIGGRQTGSLGDVEGALLEYDSAETLLRKPAGDAEAQINRNGNLSRVLQKKGELLISTDPEQAARMFTESRGLAIRVFEELGKNRQSTRRLFSILMKTGDVLADNGETGKAMIYYDEALERISDLLASEPENWELNRDIALLERRIAWLLDGEGDTDRARRLWAGSLQRMRDNLEKNEHSNRRTWDVAWSCYHYGAFLAALEGEAIAADLLVESMALMTSACTGSPAESQYRDDLDLLAPVVLEILVESGEGPRAEDALRNTLLALQPVVERMPENIALAKLHEKLLALKAQEPAP
jgi:serine/threonine protein kinase